jgi:acyl-CoA reductase-like NAD-dependent aldehyde dehydrogenase
VVVEVNASQKEIFSKELFGPIALLIKTKDTDQSIALAKEMAQKHGAISCGAYSTNEVTREKIADEMSLAATPVSFNLTGGIYMNQNAAFSDYHVTGGNPSGNASFTNPEYVTKRFTWVGHREPVKLG